VSCRLFRSSTLHFPLHSAAFLELRGAQKRSEKNKSFLGSGQHAHVLLIVCHPFGPFISLY